jgi:hypothetical protein
VDAGQRKLVMDLLATVFRALDDVRALVPKT